MEKTKRRSWKQSRCPVCKKKRNKLHQCSGKTKEAKRIEKNGIRY